MSVSIFHITSCVTSSLPISSEVGIANLIAVSLHFLSLIVLHGFFRGCGILLVQNMRFYLYYFISLATWQLNLCLHLLVVQHCFRIYSLISLNNPPCVHRCKEGWGMSLHGYQCWDGFVNGGQTALAPLLFWLNNLPGDPASTGVILRNLWIILRLFLPSRWPQ